MTLIPVYGHDALRSRLRAAAGRGALGASILLHGPQGVGKQRLALWLAQLLLCPQPSAPCGRCQTCRYSGSLTHPDLHWIFPRPRPRDADPSADEIAADYGSAIAERMATGGLYAPPSGSDAIFVATVRAMLRSAALAPSLARRKVFVFGDAERMVPQEGAEAAANAFLKLLEEPPADTTIILTSSVPGSLLPTIRSRVVSVRVPSLPDDAVREFVEDERVRAWVADAGLPADAPALVRMAGGAPGSLLGRSDSAGSHARARKILDAALSKAGRADQFALALSAGAAKARAGFTQTLDALTELLHERARHAIAGNRVREAASAATATDAVDRARILAYGNVNPQLITAALVGELEEELNG